MTDRDWKGICFPNGLGDMVEPGEVMHHCTPFEADGIAKQWAHLGAYLLPSHPPTYRRADGTWASECILCSNDSE